MYEARIIHNPRVVGARDLLQKCFDTPLSLTLAELADADLLGSTRTEFLAELDTEFIDGISAVGYDHF